MRRFGVIALLGARIAFVSAQVTTTSTTTLAASTTYIPQQSWTPNAVCSAGSSYGGPAPYGGIYKDEFGTFFDMQCGYAFTGTTYIDTSTGYVGTFAQGIATCFYGCSERPGCMGFTYTGTVAGTAANMWSGSSGRCFHFFNGTQGSLVANSGQLVSQQIYGAAYIVQAAPGTLCPFYDQQYFTDFNGITYFVQCGYQPNVAAGFGTARVTSTVANIQSCLASCDAAGSAMCNHAAYSYIQTAEPSPYTASHTLGLCTLFTGVPSASGAGQARYAMVVRTASPTGITTVRKRLCISLLAVDE